MQGFMIPPPKFDAAKKYPVKFLIHGGPQGAWGDAWSYRWNAELMAAERIRGGDGESAGIDGVWAGVCRWGER